MLAKRNSMIHASVPKINQTQGKVKAETRANHTLAYELSLRAISYANHNELYRMFPHYSTHSILFARTQTSVHALHTPHVFISPNRIVIMISWKVNRTADGLPWATCASSGAASKTKKVVESTASSRSYSSPIRRVVKRGSMMPSIANDSNRVCVCVCDAQLRPSCTYEKSYKLAE